MVPALAPVSCKKRADFSGTAPWALIKENKVSGFYFFRFRFRKSVSGFYFFFSNFGARGCIFSDLGSWGFIVSTF